MAQRFKQFAFDTKQYSVWQNSLPWSFSFFFCFTFFSFLLFGTTDPDMVEQKSPCHVILT